MSNKIIESQCIKRKSTFYSDAVATCVAVSVGELMTTNDSELLM